MNQLDFHHRPVAQARPQIEVRVAQLQRSSNVLETIASPLSHDRDQENLACLIRSLTALYPALQGSTDIAQVTLRFPETLLA